MNIIYNARVHLIRLGKVLPFLVCAIVAISYIENIYALQVEHYLVTPHYTTLNKPISFAIASYFEYDLLSIVVMLIVSIAIETCIYNKLAIGYLALQLWFKNIIINYELEPNTIIAISIINIIITTYLIYKGTKQL